MILIDDALASRIREHAQSCYPHECVGALIGHGNGSAARIGDVVPLENRRHGDEARRRFLVTAEDFRALEQTARDRDMEVLGFYHSHPDHPARPSEFDREHALPWYTYVIVSVENGTAVGLTAWTLSDDRSAFAARSIRSGHNEAPHKE